MTIGARIKRVRSERGLERRELAEKAQVPYSTLAGIEDGHQATSTRLASIAAALGVNATWLETGKGAKSLGEAPTASQSVGLDTERLATSITYILDAFAEAELPFIAAKDSDLIVAVYEELIQPESRNVIALSDWVKQLVRGRNVGQGETGGDQQDDRRAAYGARRS